MSKTLRQSSVISKKASRWLWLFAAIALVGGVWARDVIRSASLPPDLRFPVGAAVEVALVPSGDPGFRTNRAVELLQGGHVEHILISGSGHGGDSAVVLARLARFLGAPAEKIDVELSATSTWENMTLIEPWLEARRTTSLVVVTSAAHAYRAALIARKIHSKRTVWVEPVADRAGVQTWLTEGSKTFAYRLLGRIPWW